MRLGSERACGHAVLICHPRLDPGSSGFRDHSSRGLPDSKLLSFVSAKESNQRKAAPTAPVRWTSLRGSTRSAARKLDDDGAQRAIIVFGHPAPKAPTASALLSGAERELVSLRTLPTPFSIVGRDTRTLVLTRFEDASSPSMCVASVGRLRRERGRRDVSGISSSMLRAAIAQAPCKARVSL
jgi:hypothetical protein